MRAALNRRTRHLLALPLVGVLALALGVAGWTQPVLGQAYNSVPISAQLLALTQASTPSALQTASANVAASNATDGAVLTAAVTDAFNNPNSAGDQTAIGASFVSGFLSGSGTNTVDSNAASALGAALLLNNVPATSILQSALNASGNQATPQVCAFLTALVSNGATAGAFLTALGSLPGFAVATCFPQPTTS